MNTQEEIGRLEGRIDSLEDSQEGNLSTVLGQIEDLKMILDHCRQEIEELKEITEQLRHTKGILRGGRL